MIKYIVIIGGPTSSGKSKMAIDFALSIKKRYGISSEIINADSIQLYNELPILTNQPLISDLQTIPHHMYSIIPPQENMNVADWNNYAVNLIDSMKQSNILPIVVGGSGFYINSLIQGTPIVPKVSPEIRNYVRKTLDIFGRDEFYKKLLRIDYRIGERIPKSDTHRILRAYEVYKATGNSILLYLDKLNQKPPVKSVKFVLSIERQESIKRIEQRIDSIINLGVLDEIKSYNEKFGNIESQLKKALGYKEFTKYLSNEMSLQEAIELTKISTRQYAKRQVTWFRNKLEGSINVTNDNETTYQELIDNLVDHYIKYSKDDRNTALF